MLQMMTLGLREKKVSSPDHTLVRAGRRFREVSGSLTSGDFRHLMGFGEVDQASLARLHHTGEGASHSRCSPCPREKSGEERVAERFQGFLMLETSGILPKWGSTFQVLEKNPSSAVTWAQLYPFCSTGNYGPQRREH